MSNIFTPRTGNAPKGPSGGGFSGLLSVPIIAIVGRRHRRLDELHADRRRRSRREATLGPGGRHVAARLQHRHPVHGIASSSCRRATQKHTFAEPLNTYSKDIQAADNKVSVNYSIDRHKGDRGLLALRLGFSATRSSRPIVNKRFKEVFGKYEAARSSTSARSSAKRSKQAVRNNMPDGILIEGVQIENINFLDEPTKTRAKPPPRPKPPSTRPASNSNRKKSTPNASSCKPPPTPPPASLRPKPTPTPSV